MKLQRAGKVLSGCIALVLLMISSMQTVEATEWDVKRGEVDYEVEFNGASDVFIGNKKSIGTKVGTEYYMTYTVVDIKATEFRQNGITGTSVPIGGYPYLTTEDGRGGIYQYEWRNQLLKEGYSYFLKFTITEDGYEYRVACAKGEESQYLYFNQKVGDVHNNLDHFGIFSGDFELVGHLARVRCYDKNGNDLGVRVNSVNAKVSLENGVDVGTLVDDSYTLTINNSYNLAISNKQKLTADVMYMEYTVRSSNSKLWQAGVILSDIPTYTFPYLNGQMTFFQYAYDPNVCNNEPLFTEGAKYLYTFEKYEQGWIAKVEKTVNGKTESFGFPITNEFAEYDRNAGFFSIWCGDGPTFPVNAVLENFKCYDENGNNLGVQTNRAKYECSIQKNGELDSYQECEAVYYCETDGALYELFADKTLRYTEDGVAKEGTYLIADHILRTNVGDTEHTYDYLYQYFTDEEDRVFQRLHTYKVIFETGEGTKVESQKLNAENGYVPNRPEDPTLKGNKFEGWYTSDGEEFQFGKVMTESVVLYAKWADVEYASAQMAVYQQGIAIGLSAMILIVAIVGGVIIVRRKS